MFFITLYKFPQITTKWLQRSYFYHNPKFQGKANSVIEIKDLLRYNHWSCESDKLFSALCKDNNQTGQCQSYISQVKTCMTTWCCPMDLRPNFLKDNIKKFNSFYWDRSLAMIHLSASEKSWAFLLYLLSCNPLLSSITQNISSNFLCFLGF